LSFQRSSPLVYLRNLSKFNLDLVWNVVSFSLIGVIGITINILILKYYGSTELGVFNEIFAIYILLSQVATSGIHLSVQKFVPQHSDEKKKIYNIMTSAFITTLIMTCTITAICYLFRDVPGRILKSEDVSVGFLISLPGLIFFSINKVELAFLNGLRLMKSFAFFQALRYCLMLVILIVLIKLSSPGNEISFILTVSEIILFLVLNIYLIRFWKFSLSKETFHWSKTHFKFGSKAMIGNIVLDVNTKVDILVLGFFTDEGTVGVYSFASSLSDGFNQLSFVLRNNINPILTKCYFKNGKEVLERVMKGIKKSFYKIVILLGIMAIVVYPLLVSVLGIKGELAGSWIIFIILISGIIISGGYLPFQNIFNQLGYPALQSAFLFAFFFTNLLLNIILVPVLGMYGSAISTAAAFVLQALYLKSLLRKKFQLKI
jgi:O-antigen/teichoic acid export membrane protein